MRRAMLVVVAVAAVAGLMAPPAHAASGWSKCEPAVTWSVDLNGLPASKHLPRVQAAFDEWSQVTGIPFQYVGERDMLAQPGAALPGSGSTARHIDIGVFGQGKVPGLGDAVVGLAMPTFEMGGVFVAGVAVFRRSYMQTAPEYMVHALLLHEIGHVLGLPHSPYEGDVMFPTLTGSDLSRRDKAFARHVTSPCGSGQ